MAKDEKKIGTRLNTVQAALAFLTTCNTNDRWLIELEEVNDYTEEERRELVEHTIRKDITSVDLLDMVKIPRGYPLKTAKAFGDALGHGSGGLKLEGYKTRGPSPDDNGKIVDITHWYLTGEAGERNRSKVEAFIVKVLSGRVLDARYNEEAPKEKEAGA